MSLNTYLIQPVNLYQTAGSNVDLKSELNFHVILLGFRFIECISKR